MTRIVVPLFAAMLLACATPPPPAPPRPVFEPIRIGESGTPPIFFEKVIIRLPSGKVFGNVYDLAAPSRDPLELVHTSKHSETEEFNILVADRLAELGYDAVDPTEAVFTRDSTVKARFRLVGVITDMQIETGKHWRRTARNYQEVDLEMEMRLYDGAVKDVVYRKTFEGWARDEGGTPVALPDAVLMAIEGALADEEFVEHVTARPDDDALDKQVVRIPACPQSPERLPGGIAEVSKAVVTVRLGSALGSGVIVSPNGYVLTAAHLVSQDAQTVVDIGGVVELEARIEAVDPVADVALLKVSGSKHHCVSLHEGDPVGAGVSLFVIGVPLDDRLSGTVTRGIVSGRPEINGRELLQTDASINPGSSGGPVLSEDGEVLGVVSSKFFGPGVEGVGFAVPVDVIRKTLRLEVD